jgi:hypothetical protein
MSQEPALISISYGQRVNLTGQCTEENIQFILDDWLGNHKEVNMTFKSDMSAVEVVETMRKAIMYIEAQTGCSDYSVSKEC